MSKLIVVESPAKAKTIKKYLGKGYEVLASYGHVRDLIPKEGAVDPEHDFALRYERIAKNSKHVEAIQHALAKAEALYLATDPDREGEAIAWHLYALLEATLAQKPVHRVVFHEITASAVQQAVAQPRSLYMPLVNAQQARRALDYLVGFNLSPLLWRKIRTGLSAGRVQSPALRLIAERETAIEQFVQQEYWTLTAQSQQHQQPFIARLTHYAGTKLEQFSFTHAVAAQDARTAVLTAAQGVLHVIEVEKKQRRRQPAPPFTTSTLQQEAARKLGFGAQRTMRVAQQLYEGIDTGQGAVGLITYMRTDSVNLAEEALAALRRTIRSLYGADALPAQARHYKTKTKNAQEAHEAIRPTDPAQLPEKLRAALSSDQAKLYDLIWKRAIACQMNAALYHTVSVDFSAGVGHVCRATGSTLVAPGFMTVYLEDVDDAKQETDQTLPLLAVGEQVPLLDLSAEQHFTEPPPRYTEASLVKALEEYGIGRPSTYASIISTLTQREYVTLTQKRFTPTDVGRVVNKFLTDYFQNYVDYDFTARLEDDLDAVARGEIEWVPLLQRFWTPFHALVQSTQDSVKRSDVTQEKIDEPCPKCGKPLAIRLGRRGRFIGCTAYPECDYTRPLADVAQPEPEILPDRSCPRCGGELALKQSRFGKFIGCRNYPTCKYTEPLQKPEDTGITCPQCQQGSLLKKRARSGRFFYSCARYPDCRYAVFNEPVAENCPKCQWPILTLKTTQRLGTVKLCPQAECGYGVVLETGAVLTESAAPKPAARKVSSRKAAPAVEPTPIPQKRKKAATVTAPTRRRTARQS